MRRAVLGTFLILLLLSAVSSGQTFYGTTDLKTFREGRDREFRDKEKTPLTETDFAAFKGLTYFAFDKNYRVQARFKRTTDEKFFLMPTSSGVRRSS